LIEKPSVKIADLKLMVFIKDISNLDPYFNGYPNHGGCEEIE